MDSLTSVQAGRLLGVTEKTVYRLIRHGFLASHKIGAGRQHWVLMSELTRFREQHQTLPKLPPEKRYSYVPKGGQRTEQPAYKAERLAHAKAVAERQGGECLSTAYEHSHTPLRWRCAVGHEWEATFGKVVKAGTWCRQCANKSFYIESTTERTTMICP